MADYKFGVNEPPHKRWPVAWYNPMVLARSALEVLSTDHFIRNFDRRELFSGDFAVIDQSLNSRGGDYWWDFLSDTGDGGNASYTVARAILSPSLTAGAAAGVNPDTAGGFPAGQMLVLGGDLAYPGAGTEEYQYRFIEMWEAAKPTEQKPEITVASIPQNHDWFDNISSFSRHFVGNYDNHFLRASTPQNRSYFAARLPHGWWILGLDFALVGDIDREQYETFLRLIAHPAGNHPVRIQPGDNVILLYPEPYWTRPLGDSADAGYPKRYQRLEAALVAADVKIRIRLAGDLHHYVREQAGSGAELDYEDALITCGSGGAFLHPTHARRVVATKVLDRIHDSGAMTPDLEKRVRVGIGAAEELRANQRKYTQKACYPGRRISRGLCKWNLTALFKPASLSGIFADVVEGNLWQRTLRRLAELLSAFRKGNAMFPILLGALYLVAACCNSVVLSKAADLGGFEAAGQFAQTTFPSFLLLWVKALFFSPLALGAHTMLLGVYFLVAREDGPAASVCGVAFGLLHIVAAAALFWKVNQFGLAPLSMGLLIFASGAVVGGLLFGVYFAVLSRLGWLANNAFSPLAHEGYKGFLRFRIDAQGALHGFMIGTDTVPKRWIPNPNGKRPLWVEKPGQKPPKWKMRDSFTLQR